MDESIVRQRAEAHGQAIVAKDWAAAGSDVAPEIEAEMPPIMKQLPRPVEMAEVVSIEDQGESAVVQIRYSGSDGSAATVESQWADRGGQLMMVGAKVL